MTSVTERLQSIRERIESAARSAGRDASEITLVGVSKRQADERLEEAARAGLLDFGENYVQALLERQKRFPQIRRWHFIGHLQSNKASRLEGVALIHGLDSLKAARKLQASAEERDAEMPVLIHVNISAEQSKSGLAAAEVAPFLEAVRALSRVDVRGFMCIPDPQKPSRPGFAALRELRDAEAERSGLALPELSMGMSGDFEEAIAEGATLVRVGSALFGPRDT
jgi:pyridoxal phosphate enzyme (YggS family)